MTCMPTTDNRISRVAFPPLTSDKKARQANRAEIKTCRTGTPFALTCRKKEGAWPAKANPIVELKYN